MDPTTVRTVNDFFSLMGRLILYCGGIAGALAGIWALIGKIKAKGWRAATDVRIANLEDYSRKDNERLKKLESDNAAKVEEFEREGKKVCAVKEIGENIPTYREMVRL